MDQHASAAAIAERQMYLQVIKDLTYDGLVPIDAFLADFQEVIDAASYVAGLSHLQDIVKKILLRAALRDPEDPPINDFKGRTFVSPRIWLSKQPPTSVDTYNKLKVALAYHYTGTELSTGSRLSLVLSRVAESEWGTLTAFERAWGYLV